MQANGNKLYKNLPKKMYSYSNVNDKKQLSYV